MDGAEAQEPRIRETVVWVKGHKYHRVVVDFGRNKDGKRERRVFKERASAERSVATWREEQKVLTRRIGEGAQRFLTGDVHDAAAAIEIIGKGTKLAEAARDWRLIREAVGPDMPFLETAALCRAALAAGLPAAELEDAAAAAKVLGGKVSLSAAAKFYMDRNFPEGGERTCGQLVEDYLESRRAIDRRPDTLRDIRNRLGCATPRRIERQSGNWITLKPGGFALDFADVLACHVSTADLDRWLEKRSKGRRSVRRSVRVHLVGLFNFAKARRYVRENPAEPLEVAKQAKSSKSRPYAMPVEDVEKVMRFAAAEVPEAIPYLALCLFAGLRPQGEANRIDWADIHFDRREIDIKSEVSKTGDERFVDMSDNLIAWLLPHRRASGPIVCTRQAFQRVRAGANVRWAPDCMRHSFGSYHLAYHENAGKTALQMGHRTLNMLFEHYRRAVRKEDAARFWEIKPKEAAKVVAWPA